jgi:hypothetical protein
VPAGEETAGAEEGTNSAPSDTPLVDLLIDRESLEVLREDRGSAATPGSRTADESNLGHAVTTPPTAAPNAAAARSATRHSDTALSQLGIRKLVGSHVTIYTDLPDSEALDELPEIFDRAVPQWELYFRVPAVRTASWHVSAHVMESKERFREAGLLPVELPEFPHGYQQGDAFWMMKQPSDYYLRHMFLHEGTHAFMTNLMGGAGPPWYMEGIAELLATHQWKDNTLTLKWMPPSREEVPYWGRVKIIQDQFAAGEGLMLNEVFRLEAERFRQVDAYAWAWAAAAFLDGHPAYQTRFRALRQNVADGSKSFTLGFESELQHQLRQVDEEWQLFVLHADYGYDFTRAAVKYRAGSPIPAEGAEVEIAADRGWQSTGWRVEGGATYLLEAEGKFVLGRVPREWSSGPDGVTLHYYQGQPLGRLMGNVRLDQARPGIANLGRPVPLGNRRLVQPEDSGTLYLRINESPAGLADNEGTVKIRIRKEAAAAAEEESVSAKTAAAPN